MRLLLLLLVIGFVVWQYPQTLNVVADIAGVGGDDACSTTEQYFTDIGENSVSEAGKYKFPGDSFAGWIDRLDTIDSVECTCASDLSDKNIEQIRAIPNSITNVTDIQLTLFTIEGTYDGEQSTLKGSALMFRPVSKNFFVTQENIYEIDGQRQSLVNLAQFSTECEA